MGSPVDDALDRLTEALVQRRAEIIATVRSSLSALREEAEQLREERDGYQRQSSDQADEAIKWRKRAEAAEAEVQRLTDENTALAKERSAAVDAANHWHYRVRRLTEGLRETKAALDRERGGGSPLTHKQYVALHERVRALLTSPDEAKPEGGEA